MTTTTATPNANEGSQEAEQKVKFDVDLSPGFTDWFAGLGASLAITTYRVGKVIYFGTGSDGKFWTYNRNIGRCLGMATTHDEEGKRAKGMWVSSDSQIYHLLDILEPGREAPNGVDAIFLPRMSYFTGDLDVHDIAIDGQGRPVFVNTVFNCLARLHPEHSFVPIWQPDFISELVPEDRCHLNGLAMRDGKPTFVTAISQSNALDGWRDGRRDQGVVIEVATSKIVCDGLSMPHSPRWHNGKLWLLNSGRGEFGYVDMENGKFVPVAFCPGYLRGLCFIDNIAVVGLSLPRDSRAFSDLHIESELTARKIEPSCGLNFIDTDTGAIIHSLNFGGLVTELYDVAALPGMRQPAAIGPYSREIKRTLSIGKPEPI